ncbi:MmcB family DNA repair protein [Roseomonas eburnea]|uniref:MmcB family DNA repair protein n=1 Tax=Neoroseomonas eburnea TaxID=1346889 RepID=A0A9X9XBA2_9PROT|nr:MmcB family DNA repair protein [Neoroseomonas eburnea]MBR0680988.1 MmcB family DNA repair protein [Neoroseomonas eburnea]
MDAPARTLAVTRAAARFCALRGWAPVEQVPLPDGRRADILALQPSGDFVILEVKSCARDFLSDAKWPDYRAWCDRLYFAVDLDFPQELLPQDTGLVIAEDRDAALLRDAPDHRLAPARRRALLHRYAMLAGGRLAALADPAGAAELRAALRLE